MAESDLGAVVAVLVEGDEQVVVIIAPGQLQLRPQDYLLAPHT